MLQLTRAFVGRPSQHLAFLPLPSESLLVYPSADGLILLNAITLRFIRALAFWEVFPGTRESTDVVKCVATDPGMKLIIASLGTQIALWSLSGVQQDTWRVHSSLALPPGHAVSSLDCTSGLLAVATPLELSVYHLVLENDLPTWIRKWSIKTPATSNVRFSPSLTLLATTSQRDNSVRIYSTTAGRQIQAIRHPRPVTKLAWRFTRKSSRDDLILYTVTSDATARIFLPVLDTPHRLQLHAFIDSFLGTAPPSSCPNGISSPCKPASNSSNIFWLDRDTVTDALSASLATKYSSVMGEEEDGRRRRVREMSEEGWDFFLRVLSDGSLALRAVANIDRRPPTLLKQFTLAHSHSSSFPSLPTHLTLLPSTQPSGLTTLITSPPLKTHSFDPLLFFDSQASGLTLLAQQPGESESVEEGSTEKILRFVRTPEGRGVAVVRGDTVQTWHLRSSSAQLRLTGTWSVANQNAVVLDSGKRIALYDSVTRTLTLHTTSTTTESPRVEPVSIEIPEINSIFSLPSTESYTTIAGITPLCTIVHIRVSPISIHPPTLTAHRHTPLPLPSPPRLILPVDPMAWSYAVVDSGVRQHDQLLSVSHDGELAFWVLVEDEKSRVRVPEDEVWVCTGKVRTGRNGVFTKATCSSAKKSALVISGADGGDQELTIWDSKESEFASGLEYRGFFDASEPINDLDWTSTPDQQSILAVGFAHHVVLLCQQRMTYFDQEPAWGMCGRIDLGHMLPTPISDSIWITGGSLLVAAGHHMFQFGFARISRADIGAATNERREGLFEHVARLNGPLVDYHPQMILQCLLWGKIELVKEIILNLARDLEQAHEKGARVFQEWHRIPVERFLMTEGAPSKSQTKSRPYSVLFDGPQQVDDSSDEDAFSRSLVQRLIEQLEAEPLSHLTPNEHAHLVVLIQTTLEIEEQRRSLDANGLRYLISMRSFYTLNRRATSPASPADLEGSSIARQTGKRERIRYRDIVWAFHSESQEILLSASIAACGGKMMWGDARALGVFLWLNSVDTMKSHMEVIARNHYMAGDNRDPTACCLYYFALGKVKLVHGLWKQAAWHKEQPLMLKFLSNDFNETRWRTAALKNAYALLSKQRHEYAAAFFLLGGSLKDAVNVCVKQLKDFQLGVAIARVVEQGDDGPVLKGVLTNVVIPLAFENGNRWLASWAFWLLRRRDLSVRVLVTPLEDITRSLDVKITKIGDPNYDDPSLALLFSQLKSKTLQAAKGTSEISGRTEFKFVLQTARVFCRMGCHALALDLVKNWSFDRPTGAMRDIPTRDQPDEDMAGPLPPSPSISRRPGFALPPHIRRRSSIIIDMDVPSDPSSRAASPEPTNVKPSASMKVVLQPDGDLPSHKAGLGNLMKSAKQDVQVPEFDMGAFF